MVEQLAFNQLVVGSIPTGLTKARRAELKTEKAARHGADDLLFAAERPHRLEA